MNGEKQPSKGFLALSGSLTVDRAASLKSALLEGLGRGVDLTVDFGALDDLDLSCFQILLAAMRHSTARGPELHFTGTLSPKVARRLRAGGLAPQRISSGEDLELRFRETVGAKE